MSQEEIQKLIQKAEHALQAAEQLIKSGYSSDAASKSYYAMFYAARALLLSQNVDVTKHSAVESAFGLHFAKAGKLDPQYHRMLIEARRVREIADYEIDEEVEQTAASTRLKDAKDFITAIRNLLKV